MEMFEFHSIEDAFAFMAQQRERAKRSMTERQKAIQPGDYFFRPVPYGGGVGRDGRATRPMQLPVWGRILTIEELAEKEDSTTMRMLAQSREDGYHYSISYSDIEPDGEYGSVHACVMLPITKGQFEIAQAHKWDPKNGQVVQGKVAPWFQAQIEAINVILIGDNQPKN
jgi:hypothetical protein